MKKAYTVTVREIYRKDVVVYVDDIDDVSQEVSYMMESGEIEFDRVNDFESWDILYIESCKISDAEKKEVVKWAKDMVRITEIIDSDWVLDEMTELECMDWLEQLRDRGVTIPALATSSDLWTAVLEERGGRK